MQCQFRKLGYEVIDWIADYFSRDLEASKVKPGERVHIRTFAPHPHIQHAINTKTPNYLHLCLRD